MKHPSEGKAFWDKHISDWQESGLSRRAYARSAGISISRFAYWINKAKPKPTQSETASFIPVTASTPIAQSAPADFKILLSSGEVLQWRGEASAEYIQQLVKGLGQ